MMFERGWRRQQRRLKDRRLSTRTFRTDLWQAATPTNQPSNDTHNTSATHRFHPAHRLRPHPNLYIHSTHLIS